MAMPQCCFLAKGAKRPSHTTNMQTFSNKSSFNILAVTTLKASNLSSAVWDRIFIFCCMNRPRKFHCSRLKNPVLPRPLAEKCIHCLLIRDTSQFYALQPRWRWFPGCIKSLDSGGWAEIGRRNGIENQS